MLPDGHPGVQGQLESIQGATVQGTSHHNRGQAQHAHGQLLLFTAALQRGTGSPIGEHLRRLCRSTAGAGTRLSSLLLPSVLTWLLFGSILDSERLRTSVVLLPVCSPEVLLSWCWGWSVAQWYRAYLALTWAWV